MVSFYNNPKTIWNNTLSSFRLYSRNNESYKKNINLAKEKAERYRILGCNFLSQNILDYVSNIENLMQDTHQGYHRISITNAALILAKINKFKLNEIKNKFIISIKDKIYSPKLYPIHYVEEIRTDRMNVFLEQLESFFDHFMVLVPSVKRYSKRKDFQYINEKYIVPILLAEKNKKCYFISYWI
jgi:hypothetical protein